MGFYEDLDAYCRTTHAGSWTTRNGTKVPEASEVGLGKDAVLLEGAVLYADLAESTQLVRGHTDWFAAEVYKSFLYCAARVIGNRGGTITAYDGDRIMGVFIGEGKEAAAAMC